MEKENDEKAATGLAGVAGSVGLAIEELTALRAWIKDGSAYERDDAPDEIARAITNRIDQLKANAGQPSNNPGQTPEGRSPGGCL